MSVTAFFVFGNGGGFCSDHKEPIDNQLGMASSHQALPMASPSQSSVAISHDLDAKTCNYSPHYPLQAHAGSIYDQWPQQLHQKPTKMAKENPAYKLSPLSEFPSISRSSLCSHPLSTSPKFT